MFWRNKKITFRDVALNTILKDMGQESQIRATVTVGAMTMAMQLGIAIGAQFPTKVLPIIKQVEGGNSQRGYTQMKVRLERRFVSAAEMGIEARLEFFPPIAELMEVTESRGIQYFTREQFTQSVQGTFYYGLLMGNLHRKFSLAALESSIEVQNALLGLAKEAAPELFTTYPRFLSEAKETVTRYEREHGVLS